MLGLTIKDESFEEKLSTNKSQILGILAEKVENDTGAKSQGNTPPQAPIYTPNNLR